MGRAPLEEGGRPGGPPVPGRRTGRGGGRARRGDREGTNHVPATADPGGRPYALDAAAQRRVEEALREEILLHDAILDNSTLTAYIKDAGGRYVLANSRAQDLVGMTWEELRGKTDYDILPKDLADS